jgi:hypothetical protein
MKKLFITLSVLILLGMISPGTTALAQPAKTPHENPANAAHSFDGAGLLLSYSRIANQAVNNQYQSAQDVLKEMEKVSVPDDIRYVMDRYNILTGNVFTSLGNLESLLENIAGLLDRNQINEARQRLDSSEAIIQDAQYLLQDTETAARALSEKLGVFGVPTNDRLSQAFRSLENSTGRLADLLERFQKVREDLNKRCTEMLDMLPTTLDLNIEPEPAFIGDNIRASGTLTDADAPLSGKAITFIAGNVTVATATTGENGYYSASMAIPYIYANNMTIESLYESTGGDTGVYLASKSEPITIRNYSTQLEVNMPQRVYSGLPFTLSGEVSSDGNSINRRVDVFLDDRALTGITVTGRFSLELTPPADAIQGRHILTVTLAPDGRYSGATEKIDVNLTTMLLHIEAQTPGIVFYRAPFKSTARLRTNWDLWRIRLSCSSG